MNEVDELVRRTHKQLWHDWHGDNPPYPQAKLIVTHNENGAYYNNTKDEICIDIPDGNLTDLDILNADEWPVWKVDLVEEMLHEIQYKNPTSVNSFIRHGEELCEEHSKHFAGKGHDAIFFASVAKHAPSFNLSAEELITALRGRISPKYPNLPMS